jgi:hypothetical protein
MEEGDPGAIVLDLHSAKEKIENAINMIEGSIKASIGAA